MIDWTAIADRVHLLARERGFASHAVALDAGLQGADLVERLQTGSVAETVRAIASVVRIYGADPTWLVTGSFDATTHRVALDGSFNDTWRLVQRLLIEQSAPAHEDEDDLTVNV